MAFRRKIFGLKHDLTIPIKSSDLFSEVVFFVSRISKFLPEVLTILLEPSPYWISVLSVSFLSEL